MAGEPRPRFTVYNTVALMVTGFWLLANLVATIDPSRPVSSEVHGITATVVTGLFIGGQVAEAVKRRRNGNGNGGQ